MNPARRRRSPRRGAPSGASRFDVPPSGWPTLSVRPSAGARPAEWFLLLTGRVLFWSESERAARARLAALTALVARRAKQGVATTFADLLLECGPREPYRFDEQDPPVLALFAVPSRPSLDGRPRFARVDPARIRVDFVTESPPTAE